MANVLARLTMTWVPPRARHSPTREPSAIEPAGERIPVFTSPKALTFPIVTGLVKAAWDTLKAVQLDWASSPLVPLVMCVALGMAITVANLLEEKPKPMGWVLGLAVGLLNSLVICGAVLGIPVSAAPNVGGG